MLIVQYILEVHWTSWKYVFVRHIPDRNITHFDQKLNPCPIRSTSRVLQTPLDTTENFNNLE